MEVSSFFFSSFPLLRFCGSFPLCSVRVKVRGVVPLWAFVMVWLKTVTKSGPTHQKERLTKVYRTKLCLVHHTHTHTHPHRGLQAEPCDLPSAPKRITKIPNQKIDLFTHSLQNGSKMPILSSLWDRYSLNPHTQRLTSTGAPNNCSVQKFKIYFMLCVCLSNTPHTHTSPAFCFLFINKTKP